MFQQGGGPDDPGNKPGQVQTDKPRGPGKGGGHGLTEEEISRRRPG